MSATDLAFVVTLAGRTNSPLQVAGNFAGGDVRRVFVDGYSVGHVRVGGSARRIRAGVGRPGTCVLAPGRVAVKSIIGGRIAGVISRRRV